MRTTGSKIIVSPLPEPEETIILLDKSKTTPRTGIVVAAGPQSDYRVGMTLTYIRFAGTPIEHEGKDYTVINPGDVLKING